MKNIDITALILVVIGAINWGLVGILDFNLVVFLFGKVSVITSAIYIFIGLSGFYVITFLNKIK